MAVVVRGRQAHDDVPYLRAPELFLGGLARDLALEHHVAVVRRPDDAPAVLRQDVEEAGDLGEPLRLFGHVLAQPRGIRALTAIFTIKLVTDGPEDVDEDVRRTGHGRSLGLAPLLHEAVSTIGVLRDDDERAAFEACLSLERGADQVVVLVLRRNADAVL
jgi:hypothetical protein